MNRTFELMICIDKLGNKGIIIEKGTIDQIDIITTQFESPQEIRENFIDIINNFEEIYSEYMKKITAKTKRQETGDIALIEITNQEKTRIKVLYKKHIEIFKTIIYLKDFEMYLKDNYYTEYCKMQKYSYQEITINEETSFFIRKLYDIYKKYARDNRKPSPDVIYSKIKKQKNTQYDNYQGIYDESGNDPTDPEQLEAYELEYNEEKIDNYKYQVESQKTKKISRGKKQ